MITDATCPKVMRIHKIVEKASADGKLVVIVGMKNHPEVEAIEGWCGGHIVAENAAELEAALSAQPSANAERSRIQIQHASEVVVDLLEGGGVSFLQANGTDLYTLEISFFDKNGNPTSLSGMTFYAQLEGENAYVGVAKNQLKNTDIP